MAFARLAEKNAVPNRRIAGQQTRLSRTMHDIRYDAAHDEFIVGNPFAQAILTFRGAADGEEAPVRMIHGPNTQLLKPDNVDIDPVNNEIINAEPETNQIYVYPRTANGDVKPIRVLDGNGMGWSIGNASVDPENDVLVGTGDYESEDGESEHAIMIFDRTASGKVKPRAVIKGPRSGLRGTRQIQAYKGWIIVAHAGRGDGEKPENIFIGVWSINDSGDVPPRWRIGGPDTTLKNPRGVVLNPKAKEVIVADMRLNMVLTFSFPELFAADFRRPR